MLADSAYGTGQARTALADVGHRALIRPIPLRSAVEGGFTRDDFVVDEAAGQVSCPVGHIVSITRTRKAASGSAAVTVS